MSRVARLTLQRRLYDGALWIGELRSRRDHIGVIGGELRNHPNQRFHQTCLSGLFRDTKAALLKRSNT